MFDTNFCFNGGKLTTILDASAGSSGKGKIGSFIAEYADNWQFCCNTFMPQAGHWIKLEDGRTYFYQTFNSCAYIHEKFDKMYIGPGSTIELPAFFRELEENKIPHNKIGISPVTAILQDIDAEYERGEVDLEGNRLKKLGLGTMKSGSTCINRHTIVETEDGPKTIKEIVDNKYTGNVLSYDIKRKKFVYNKVINHWSKRNKNKKWVSINNRNNRKKLVCTDDHKCMIIDDIFKPELEYMEAKNVAGKFIIKQPILIKEHYNGNLYNKEQMSAMIGSMFGDGSIHKGYFISEHGHKQLNYINNKNKLFGGRIEEFRSGWNRENKSYRLCTNSNAQTRSLRDLFYDGSKKVVSRALEYLDAIGLAFWYMDDGTLVKKRGIGKNAVFCTDSFSNNDNKSIIKWFKDEHDIDAVISCRNRIRLNVEGSKKLWSIIAPYIYEDFNYKMPDEYSEIDKHNYNVNNLSYAADKVEIVKYLPKTSHYASKLFDIEVESTHNFVAGDIVVHNCHGVGACKARKILRKPNMKLARDVDELKPYLCNVPDEIMTRLDSGQAGLLEIAQGFQLSYLLPEFYPFTTSRNCTVSAGLDDMMLPPKYAGNVILNLRTYPIRINNKKYISTEDGHHLTWQEIQDNVPHEVKVFNSGPGYDDQHEMTWEELTELSGSPEPIMEMTSVTKLPRRVFSFSQENIRQAIKYNDAGGDIFISLNFVNYVDHEMTGKSGCGTSFVTNKVKEWTVKNMEPVLTGNVDLKFLGTGPKLNDMVMV